MSRTDTLRSLEIILESFLERAVSVKEQRLRILSGINRLDDIAHEVSAGRDVTDEIGGWFAEHSRWLDEPSLRIADRNRIGQILGSIKSELGTGTDDSPASSKIGREIDRWSETVSSGTQKLILKRAPESQKTEGETDSITLFNNTLRALSDMSDTLGKSHKHVLSILDDTLKSALMQRSKQALLLSGFIIYYLKQSGYKVEPYVKRLKEAESVQAGTK